MRRDPVGDFKQRTQPGLFAFALQFNIHPPFRTPTDPTTGDGYNIDQLVFLRPLLAWVSLFAEMFFKRFPSLLGPSSSSGYPVLPYFSGDGPNHNDGNNVIHGMVHFVMPFPRTNDNKHIFKNRG